MMLPTLSQKCLVDTFTTQSDPKEAILLNTTSPKEMVQEKYGFCAMD
jgi:hypothetical protein